MLAPAPRINVPAPSAAMTLRNASIVEVYLMPSEPPPTVIIIRRRIVSNGYLGMLVFLSTFYLVWHLGQQGKG